MSNITIHPHTTFGYKYKKAAWAEKFLNEWCKRTMRSRLPPMKKMAKMLRAHKGLLMNWFRDREKIALGAVEGLNNKAKVTCRKSYDFLNYGVLKVALYHALGQLPEPEDTHKFC